MMKFDMATPCKHCPFRADIPGFLTEGRAYDIGIGVVYGNAEFPCHKTLDYDREEEEEPLHTEATNFCAGAMILSEKENPGGNQILRIAERFGLYRPDALNTDAPVFDTVSEMAEHHGYSRQEATP